MEIPLQAYSADITDYQFRLLAYLCLKSGTSGRYKASIASMGIETGNVNEKTVRRALIGLEKAGLISKTRTKGANGKDSLLSVDISGPVDSARTNEAQDDWASNVRTSHDYKSRSHTANKPLVPNSQDSYQLKDLGNTKSVSLKEIKVPMRKYEDDGEDLAGFGLVEKEIAHIRRDHKT